MKSILSIFFILCGQSLVAVDSDNGNQLTIENLAPLYSSKLVDSIASNKIHPSNIKKFRHHPIMHHEFVEEFKKVGEKILQKQREPRVYDSEYLRN